MSRFALLSAIGLAHGAELLVIGDSWGSEGKGAFERMFSTRGIDVSIQNIAVGGTTSKDWASSRYTKKLMDAIGPETKHIWLTIGGNDLIADLPLCGLPCIDESVQKISSNIHSFIEPALNANPNAQVVQFGYDVLIFNHYVLCAGMGPVMVPQCKGDIACTNSNFLGAMKSMLGNATSGVDRHTTIDISGTVQQEGGIANASVGHPNLAFYSPYQLMQSNCIHPTRGTSSERGGFDAVMDSFYELYFKPFYPAVSGRVGTVTDVPPPEWVIADNAANRMNNVACGQMPCLF